MNESLQTSMTRLRLSGMAASLDVRLQEAAGHHLGHGEFLELVLQDELPSELFVNALCQSLKLTPVERQSLLDCDTVVSRCARLLEILDFQFLEHTYGKGRSIH